MSDRHEDRSIEYRYREIQYREIEVRTVGFPSEGEQLETLEGVGEDLPLDARVSLSGPTQITSQRSPEQSVAMLSQAGWQDRQARNPTAQYLPRHPTNTVSYVTASPQDHAQRIEEFGATPLDQHRGTAKREFTAAMQGNTESVVVQEDRQHQPLPERERKPIHPVLDAKGEQMQADFEAARTGEGEGKEEAGGIGSQQVSESRPQHNLQPPPEYRQGVDRGVHRAKKTADHFRSQSVQPEPAVAPRQSLNMHKYGSVPADVWDERVKQSKQRLEGWPQQSERQESKSNNNEPTEKPSINRQMRAANQAADKLDKSESETSTRPDRGALVDAYLDKTYGEALQQGETKGSQSEATVDRGSNVSPTAAPNMGLGLGD